MRLFGTDGIRAPFGDYPLDRKTVVHLGHHLGGLLSQEVGSPTVVMGGDTRESTPEICRWLATGLEAGGANPVYGGVLPTPAVANAVIQSRADAGVSVSASHNPHPYNGIKLFDGSGFKWSPEAEKTLESLLHRQNPQPFELCPDLVPDSSLAKSYLETLRDRLGQGRPFAGLRIVLDTANGAATPFAEPLFRALGADIVAIGNRPDGHNINAECGSTVPDAMVAAVVDHDADLGVAFDGDADRALFADEQGQLRDGDAMLFAWARYLQAGGRLSPPSIVATSMSNLGLERALQVLNIGVVRCDVGDRTVVATMRDRSIHLGGEQSGHLVHLGTSTTGDGLATALQMTKILQEAQVPLSVLLQDFRRFPQVLQNIQVASKPDLKTLPRVAEAAAEVENRLGDQGRLVLRYSGTEPLARVMIEGLEMEEIEFLASLIINAIRDEVGEPQD